MVVAGPLACQSAALPYEDCWPALPVDALDACVPQVRLARRYAWKLEAPIRFEHPCAVGYLPHGIWFYPFQRRGDGLPD